MIDQEKKSPQITLLSGKIQACHYDRLAIVYVRQSTLQQVERHSESTKLQYNLVGRAYDLGWSANRVVIIDDDLGQSGSTAEGRPGFQRLVAEVGLNRVGIVLGIEISRLARSCRDWYQLLEVCALFRTLIADTDGVYDPVSYNDRLLLGLKGTMSEAELHIIKQRMLQGKKAKARRGELGMQVPMGYVRRASGEIIKDLDEQAQTIIQMVFELFDKFSTINAVLKYLAKNNIQMPYRERSGLQKGELAWHRPNRATLSNLLHNPIYAGAYVYGRRPTEPHKKKLGRPSTGRTVAKMSDWEVMIKDKVPAYISWQQYERNQRQLLTNSIQGIGIARQGSSLLTGLIVCGRCGLRMVTCYTNNSNKLRYICRRMAVDYAEDTCQSLVGDGLDELITNQALEVLKPSALEVSLRVATDAEQEHNNLQKHWHKQLERAKYEVERSYRQYNASEPENRLVTRTLEKKWEESLSAEEKLKQEYNKFLANQSKILSSTERELIYKLANDIPALWASETTTVEERKEILRLLIERVLVTVEGISEKVSVEIHWSGGYKTSTNFIRPVAKPEQLSYYHELIALTTSLRTQGMTLQQIADNLNQQGLHPPKLLGGFSKNIVGTLLSRNNVIPFHRKTLSAGVDRTYDEFTFSELSQETNVPQPTLYKWMQQGGLKARKAKNTLNRWIWLITADEQEIKRLSSLREQPKQWIYHSRVEKVD
ncbi:recombinase family protein [Candidatus Tisiphia endosymbiont of Ditula angustiorana]|uniref:recombinase family protein n=1 Tax=Candidatus Tisiphia endosymbiont of Ditula angustiorana TaxID=3066272 RepID=UPI00312CABE5